jgi:hypothetical protein
MVKGFSIHVLVHGKDEILPEAPAPDTNPVTDGEWARFVARFNHNTATRTEFTLAFSQRLAKC